MPGQPLILTPGSEHDTNRAIERRLRADAIARQVMKYPSGTPERWKAIRAVWYGMDKDAREDHHAAIIEATKVRRDLQDKDYGRTMATQGKAIDEKSINGHIYNSLVAIMPENLKTWLVKFDPYLNKRFNKGAREQRRAWRRLYATFPEYRTTLKQESF